MAPQAAHSTTKVSFASPSLLTRTYSPPPSQPRSGSVDMSTQTSNHVELCWPTAVGLPPDNGSLFKHDEDDEHWLLHPNQIGSLPSPSAAASVPVASIRLLQHSSSTYVPAQIVSAASDSIQLGSKRRASLVPESAAATQRAALFTRSKTTPLREQYINGDENAPTPIPAALYRGIILGLRFVHNFNALNVGVDEESEQKQREFCKNVSTAAADDNLSDQEKHQVYCQAVLTKLLTQEQIAECRSMQNLSHDNVTLFVGTAFTFRTENSAEKHESYFGTPPITVTLGFQHCPRGTLASVLRSYDEATRASLADWQFRQTIIDDVVHGLQYLHENLDHEEWYSSNKICLHGRLSSDTILLDWRWCAKLTDFGMWSLGYAEGPVQWLRKVQQQSELLTIIATENDAEFAARKLLWVAPEIMRVPELFTKATSTQSEAAIGNVHKMCNGGGRRHSVDSNGSGHSGLLEVQKRCTTSRRKAVVENVQRADIYSLGVVMSEILYQCSPPYSDTGLELRQVIDAVKCGIVPKPDGFNYNSGQQALFPANNYLSSKRRNSVATTIAVKLVLRPCHEPLPSDSFDSNHAHQATAERYRQLMQLCWREAPNERPDMAKISLLIDEASDDDDEYINGDDDLDTDPPHSNGFRAPPVHRQFSEPLKNGQSNPLMSAKSVIDNTMLIRQNRQTAQTCRKTMHKLDKYAHALELLVERRTRELLDEKQRADELLARLMPISVAERLKRGEPVEPEHFESCTVFFSDLVGFTTISERSTPMQVVQLLNQLYSQFDSICERYNVYKLETVGDAYIVMSGAPVRHAHHAAEIAGMALEFQALVQRQFTYDLVERHIPEIQCVRMRMGINTGPVVAAVLGVNMPRYSVFGDTMNVAARMESHGVPMKIQLSYAAKKALETWPEFVVEERGLCNVKGKGKMLTYWLVAGPQTEAV